MNRATRIVLAARELISEIESDYRVPLHQVQGRFIDPVVKRETVLRLRNAISTVGIRMVPYDGPDRDAFMGRLVDQEGNPFTARIECSPPGFWIKTSF